MTMVLCFIHAIGALVLVATARTSTATQERVTRVVAGIGLLAGAGMFVGRDLLPAWRGLSWDPDVAAVAGLSIACAWGLVISLDLETDRWWVGGLVGVTATSTSVFAAGDWTFLVVAFLICGSIACGVAAARSRAVGWLALVLADGALVAALISDAVEGGSWDTGAPLTTWLVVPVLISAGLRAGLLPRTGAWALLRSPAAALTPLLVGLSMITIMRWVERPVGPAAAVALAVAIGMAGFCVLRRILDPSVLGTWPVGVAIGLSLVSEPATVPAACAGILGASVVCLWPDAIERGRLSRGAVLSCLIPTVGFGALAIGAREAFDRALGSTDPIDVVSWGAVSALLPLTLAAGVALAVFAARSEQSGGYHPEAVFMTWVLAAGALGVGVALGTGAVYGALGGGPAAVLFGVSVAFGVAAGSRVEEGQAPSGEASARVFLGSPPALGNWVAMLCIALHLGAFVGVGWFAYQGLDVGFL
jgi:hypothetical protein